MADPKGGGVPGTRQARLRTGSTRPPHAGDAAVPHREEKLAGGGRRAGGRESRRGEPLPSATPRSPFPPLRSCGGGARCHSPQRGGQFHSLRHGGGRGSLRVGRVSLGKAGGNWPRSPAVPPTGSRGTRRAPRTTGLTFRRRHGARRRLQDRRAGAARRAPPLLPSHHRVRRGRPERPAARAEPSSRAPSRLDILECILLHPAAFRSCFTGSKHPGIPHAYFSLPGASS